MSADEDTELRDLVAQTLEANGVLGKIRAQLRSSVFLALEEQESIQNKTPFANAELNKYVKTPEGRIVTGLVREFLEHFNMEFTLAVYDPESNIGDQYEGRSSLARELNIIDSDKSSQLPLLALVVKQQGGEDGPRKRLPSGAEASTATASASASSAVSSATSSPPQTSPSSSEPQEGTKAQMGSLGSMGSPRDLTPQMLEEARRKFEQYDEDNSGTIEKDELRALFIDMFPSFHRNMLDRYVNDEFRAADRDFSNAIDFEEFLGMYKRFFVLCKTSVSSDVNDLVSPRLTASKIPSPRSRKGASGSSQVENKNKRNLDSNLSGDNRSTRNSDPFQNDDDDPFFDEPIPSNNNTKSFSSSDKQKKDVKFDSKLEKGPSVGGLSSLAGLPSLAPNETQKPAKTLDFEKDIKAIDKNLTDLGFDVPEDDYDDDFESSKSEKSLRSERSNSEPKSGRRAGSVSPFGATPRSARSDHNVKSLEEELDEEIEEDLSVGEDLLRSDNSGMDDLTTDRTVSPDNQSSAIDYMEDVMVP